MSPEQAEAKPVDPRSDIFSFGAVLYEMLTGQLAFQGESKAMTLASILQKEPKPLAEVIENVPPELDRVVSRCLRKDPQRRWQSMADLKVALLDLKEESDSGRLSAPAALPPPRRAARRVWLLLAGAVLLAAAVAGIWWFQGKAPVEPELKFTRFTFDSGATVTGAISPDGKLITFASDREDASNLDIYVQQVSGGRASRITRHPADDITPRFSPDGTRIVFHSKRDGGGVYVIDTLGGEERKIADRGFHPSFSPDGSLIVFTVKPVAANNILNKMYLVPSQGGDPKPFQPDFGVASSMNMGPEPLWSPDGKYLLFEGLRAKEARSFDWWVAPVSGGEPVRTGVGKIRIEERIIWSYPTAWHGNRIIFSAGASPSEESTVFSVPLTPDPWRISGPPSRLYTAPGHNTVSSVAADGQVVLNSATNESAIYSLPLDPRNGAVTAAPERLTHDQTVKGAPAVSRDGSRLAWCSLITRPLRYEIHSREMIDRRESVLMGRSNTFAVLRPLTRLSADGSMLAYQDAFEGKYRAFVVAGRTATPREFCESCTIQSFFPDPNKLLVQYGDQLVSQDLNKPDRRPVLKWNSGRIIDADVSPDGAWAVASLTRNTGSNAIYIVPVRDVPAPERDWILVADEEYLLDSPVWSADGNLVYFLSGRDGRTCIWAQRLEPGTRKPAGPTFKIYNENRARFDLIPTRWHKIAAARDRLIALMSETTANIWLATLGPE
jgi:Tol biopolymer transport system component